MSDSAALRTVPVREDCWSQEASKTLIEAWGRSYVELNRGNLRQKDWKQVADIVNARHGHTKKTYRTDVQCKNRIDTIKKKYKVEKARVSASGGMVVSSWPFFDRLDELIGSNLKKPATGGGAVASVSVSKSLSHSPPMALPLPHSYRTSAAPLAAAVLSKKRASPAADDSYFRRNYSAVAAAAAASSPSTEDDDGNEDDGEGDGDEVEVEEEEEMLKGCSGKKLSEDGVMKLAMAIRKFGDVYAKVEAEKQNQMVEMEKQRIQFIKDLEVQRMQMYVNMQLQLKKIKIAKASRSNDESS